MDQNLGIVRNASRSQHVERGGGTVHTLVTAVNDAMKKVDEMTEKELGKVTGGLKLPGMF